MILLIDFFKNMKHYTIIKMDKNFPFFKIGKDDVDILCLDINETVNHITTILNTRYKQYTYRYNKKFNQLDVYNLDNFIIKFDLFDDLSTMYPSYNIPPGLTQSIISNSILKTNFKIPLIKDELMIRQLEYDTWIRKRPDKIKHLHFIKSHPNIIYKRFSSKK